MEKDGYGYPSCEQLGLGKSDRTPTGPRNTASIVADAKRRLSIKMIEQVEAYGPASCAATQYGDTRQRTIYVFLATNITRNEALTLGTAEIQYLKKLGLFSSIHSYVNIHP